MCTDYRVAARPSSSPAEASYTGAGTGFAWADRSRGEKGERRCRRYWGEPDCVRGAKEGVSPRIIGIWSPLTDGFCAFPIAVKWGVNVLNFHCSLLWHCASLLGRCG